MRSEIIYLLRQTLHSIMNPECINIAYQLNGILNYIRNKSPTASLLNSKRQSTSNVKENMSLCHHRNATKHINLNSKSVAIVRQMHFIHESSDVKMQIDFFGVGKLNSRHKIDLNKRHSISGVGERMI